MEYTLREWSIVDRNADNPYQAPELRRMRLYGRIYGREGFPDGEFVTTSSVVGSSGRVVETRSGSRYRLDGPPSEGYTKYLAENRISLDENQPVKVLR